MVKDFCWSSHPLVSLEVWQGASSCTKITILFSVIKGKTWCFKTSKYRPLFMVVPLYKNTRFVFCVPVIPSIHTHTHTQIHTARNCVKRKGISNVLRSICLPNSPTHLQASWLLSSVKIALIRKEHFIPLCYGSALMSFCQLQTCNFITLFTPWLSPCNLLCNSIFFKHSGHSLSGDIFSNNTRATQLSEGLEWT